MEKNFHWILYPVLFRGLPPTSKGRKANETTRVLYPCRKVTIWHSLLHAKWLIRERANVKSTGLHCIMQNVINNIEYKGQWINCMAYVCCMGLRVGSMTRTPYQCGATDTGRESLGVTSCCRQKRTLQQMRSSCMRLHAPLFILPLIN